MPHALIILAGDLFLMQDSFLLKSGNYEVIFPQAPGKKKKKLAGEVVLEARLFFGFHNNGHLHSVTLGIISPSE